LLALCMFLGAALYTSVGHAGASAYIALMALFCVVPTVMRPTALVLNILVAFRGGIKRSRHSRNAVVSPDNAIDGLTGNRLGLPLQKDLNCESCFVSSAESNRRACFYPLLRHSGAATHRRDARRKLVLSDFRPVRDGSPNLGGLGKRQK
jgi:hypothetical protein